MRKFSKNFSSINKKRLYDPENQRAYREFYIYKTDRGEIYLNMQKKREKSEFYKSEDFNNEFFKKYYSYDIKGWKTIASYYFNFLNKFKSKKLMLKFWRKYFTAQRNNERRRNRKIKAAESNQEGRTTRPEVKMPPKKRATADSKYYVVCAQSDMDDEKY